MMFRHPHPLAETTDASTADAEKDRWTAGPSTTLRSGRDDKGEGRFRGEQLQEESRFHHPGWAAHDPSGRDDNYISLHLFRSLQNCHPDRSEA